MFRDLIPALEDQFHLIAPDYPGFGRSDMPPRTSFAYTFDHLADIVRQFADEMGLEKFFLYVFDYGAPIGFRLAKSEPARILGIISQNGNIYQEGLGKKWEARAEYWRHPTPELREQYKSAFAPQTIIGQYTFGTEPGSVSPDGYTLDIHYTERPEYGEIQSDLIFDYQTNVALYPAFQAYLREYQPPLLAVWGKTIRRLFLPGLKPSDETFRMPKFILWTAVTSLWNRAAAKSRLTSEPLRIGLSAAR